jgi:hypothetical protein
MDIPKIYMNRLFWTNLLNMAKVRYFEVMLEQVLNHSV